MPELAEVEFYRKQWDRGLGCAVANVAVHRRARVFRGCDAARLQQVFAGSRLVKSQAHGKRLLFTFRQRDGGGQWLWLAMHLGMSGKLSAGEASHRPARHEHLVIYLQPAALIFSDPRMFGKVEFGAGEPVPGWWRGLPPAVLSSRFTRRRVGEFIDRHKRTIIKAVLLMQEGFPGLGNWMVDEVLWRAGIHPARRGDSLSGEERESLFRAIKFVCRGAMNTIGNDFRDPPKGWLFHQRWKRGGVCPRTGAPLVYEEIAGRSTCWSPQSQQ